MRLRNEPKSRTSSDCFESESLATLRPATSVVAAGARRHPSGSTTIASTTGVLKLALRLQPLPLQASRPRLARRKQDKTGESLKALHSYDLAYDSKLKLPVRGGPRS